MIEKKKFSKKTGSLDTATFSKVEMYWNKEHKENVDNCIHTKFAYFDVLQTVFVFSQLVEYCASIGIDHPHPIWNSNTHIKAVARIWCAKDWWLPVILYYWSVR